MTPKRIKWFGLGLISLISLALIVFWMSQGNQETTLSAGQSVQVSSQLSQASSKASISKGPDQPAQAVGTSSQTSESLEGSSSGQTYLTYKTLKVAICEWQTDFSLTGENLSVEENQTLEIPVENYLPTDKVFHSYMLLNSETQEKVYFIEGLLSLSYADVADYDTLVLSYLPADGQTRDKSETFDQTETNTTPFSDYSREAVEAAELWLYLTGDASDSLNLSAIAPAGTKIYSQNGLGHTYPYPTRWLTSSSGDPTAILYASHGDGTVTVYPAPYNWHLSEENLNDAAYINQYTQDILDKAETFQVPRMTHDAVLELLWQLSIAT